MLQAFQNFIQKKKLFKGEDKILLAVSGGVDSVCMCELFYQNKFSFALAHCNFKLRGKESDEDEKFVRTLAEKYKVEFFNISFNTDEYAAEKGISIQMAARDLRYKWLEKIRAKNNFEYVSVAHHRDDVVETFFINLLRGTGISGLTGIKEKNNKIIRPLLFASKKEIKNYVEGNNLKFREDSSNSSDDYTRNKVRNKIIPLFKEINPAFEETMIANIERLKDVEEVFSKHISEIKKEVLSIEGDNTNLNIKKLLARENSQSLLYEALKEFNVNVINIRDIHTSLLGQPGKVFLTPTHKILKDRGDLIISKLAQKNNISIEIKEATSEIAEPVKMVFKKIKNEKDACIKDKSFACLDCDKLKFPLILRNVLPGDKFQPLGLKGMKKLSDFFIDEKVSLTEKENSYVLLSDNDIVWVVGRRISEKYKIHPETENVYLIELLEKY